MKFLKFLQFFLRCQIGYQVGFVFSPVLLQDCFASVYFSARRPPHNNPSACMCPPAYFPLSLIIHHQLAFSYDGESIATFVLPDDIPCLTDCLEWHFSNLVFHLRLSNMSILSTSFYHYLNFLVDAQMEDC